MNNKTMLDKNKNHAIIELFLAVISILLLLGLFLKSILDIDGSWDTWNYHLPFAARIWGIVPKTEYTFENIMEYRYQGFPLLASTLQGFLWLVFQRVQAANLVSFFSLILYIAFLKKYLQVPLYLSTITILSIPLVQIHSTSSYIDLLTNVFTSIFLIMIYKQGRYLLDKNNVTILFKDLFISLTFAAFAANTKFQAIPIILFTLINYLGILIYKYIISSKENHHKLYSIKLRICIISIIISLPLIFATPTKNLILHQNPFYPIQIQLFGHTFNYTEKTYKDSPNYLKNSPQFQRWIFSILEINSYDSNRPFLWTIDQGNVDRDSPANRMGGYFGAYILFNIGLLLYLCLHKNFVTRTYTIISFGIISIVTSIMPQSHELRYYMYWVIFLVSLNMYLIASNNDWEMKKPIFIDKTKMALSSVFFLFIVAFSTKFTYLLPHFFTLSSIKQNVDIQVLAKIESSEEQNFCLVGKQPFSFLYTSYFQQQSKYNLKATYKKEQCGNYKIIN
jgi:hypothetical protein